MSKLLSSVAGGSGVFLVKFISGSLSIAPGPSGDLVTITPPSGRRVSLDFLYMSGSLSEANIEVEVGGESVVSGDLDDGNATAQTNKFAIGPRVTSSNGVQKDPLIGRVDEVVIIRKTTGTLSATMFYSYRFGV